MNRIDGRFDIEGLTREYRIDGTQVWTRTLGEEEWHFDPENTAMRERLAERQTSPTSEGRES